MDKKSKIEVLKECKFLQLGEHQTGVQLTLLSCIFTPKWCKYDLHTILNAFKNSNTDLVYIFSILVFSNTKIKWVNVNQFWC